jgi:hypothetical protein
MIFSFLAFAGTVFSAMSGNTWNFDVEANTDQIQPYQREFARGETWNIAPRVLDDGAPRAWSSNTTFTFFWQKPNMLTNWWASTNGTFPVYNGSAISTGRASMVWNGATMDIGANQYNWFIRGVDDVGTSYRVSGTISMKGSPGAGVTFAGDPVSWTFATTSFVNSAVAAEAAIRSNADVAINLRVDNLIVSAGLSTQDVLNAIASAAPTSRVAYADNAGTAGVALVALGGWPVQSVNGQTGDVTVVATLPAGAVTATNQGVAGQSLFYSTGAPTGTNVGYWATAAGSGDMRKSEYDAGGAKQVAFKDELTASTNSVGFTNAVRAAQTNVNLAGYATTAHVALVSNAVVAANSTGATHTVQIAALDGRTNVWNAALTNNGVTINGVPLGNGTNLTIAGGGASTGDAYRVIQVDTGAWVYVSQTNAWLVSNGGVLITTQQVYSVVTNLIVVAGGTWQGGDAAVGTVFDVVTTYNGVRKWENTVEWGLGYVVKITTEDTAYNFNDDLGDYGNMFTNRTTGFATGAGTYVCYWSDDATIGDTVILAEQVITNLLQTTTNNFSSTNMLLTANGNGSGLTGITAAQVGAVSNTPAGIVAAGGLTGAVYAAQDGPTWSAGLLTIGTNLLGGAAAAAQATADAANATGATHTAQLSTQDAFRAASRVNYSTNSGDAATLGGYTATQLLSQVGTVYYVWGSLAGPFTGVATKMAQLASPYALGVWTSTVVGVTNLMPLGYVSINTNELPRFTVPGREIAHISIERDGNSQERTMRVCKSVYESNQVTLVSHVCGDAKAIPQGRNHLDFDLLETTETTITDDRRYIVYSFTTVSGWGGGETIKVYSQDGELTYITTAGGAGVYASQSALDTHTTNTNNPHAVTAAQVGAVSTNGAASSLVFTNMLSSFSNAVQLAQNQPDTFRTWHLWSASNSGFAPAYRLMRTLDYGSTGEGIWTNAAITNNQYVGYIDGELGDGLTLYKGGSVFEFTPTMWATLGGSATLSASVEMYLRETNGVERELTPISGTEAQVITASALKYVYRWSFSNDVTKTATESPLIKFKLTKGGSGTVNFYISTGHLDIPTPSTAYTLQSVMDAHAALSKHATADMPFQPWSTTLTPPVSGGTNTILYSHGTLVYVAPTGTQSIAFQPIASGGWTTNGGINRVRVVIGPSAFTTGVESNAAVVWANAMNINTAKFSSFIVNIIRTNVVLTFLTPQ